MSREAIAEYLYDAFTRPLTGVDWNKIGEHRREAHRKKAEELSSKLRELGYVQRSDVLKEVGKWLRDYCEDVIVPEYIEVFERGEMPTWVGQPALDV